MTHDKLVDLSAKWLRKHTQNIVIPNCSLILKDLSTSHLSRPDVIGFNSNVSVLLEIKISRADFLSESKKEVRKNENLEVGEFKYYVCPEGLIKVEDLPNKWGLIYYVNGQFEIIKVSEHFNVNYKGERTMLLSLLRRKNIKGN